MYRYWLDGSEGRVGWPEVRLNDAAVHATLVRECVPLLVVGIDLVELQHRELHLTWETCVF